MPRSEHQSLITHPLRLLCALAVLLVPLFGLMSAGTAHAATTVTISDGASCEAAGGTWPGPGTPRCTLGDFTVAADTILQITVDTNFSSLTNYGSVTISARSGTNALINAAGAMLNINGSLGLYAASSNAGTITIKSGSMGVVAPLTNTSSGQITIQNGAGLFLLNALTNQGTITTICDGYVYYGDHGSLTGNPVQTSCPPSDTSAPVITHSISGTTGSNGWYVSDVTVSWSVTDAESAISSQTGCDPSTVTSDTAGDTFTCTASSAGGTASKSVTVKRDATNPSVSYTGNAGTYTIDQTVSISCTAADNLSGIASSSCANISGPAYSFALGTNTRSASATDKAGNTGSGSTTFTVGVTFDSLCTLSANFSTDPAVDKGLCDKLAAAKAAAASGDTNTKKNNLNAYRQQVAAQSGKAVTKQQATILTNLSKAL